MKQKKPKTAIAENNIQKLVHNAIMSHINVAFDKRQATLNQLRTQLKFKRIDDDTIGIFFPNCLSNQDKKLIIETSVMNLRNSLSIVFTVDYPYKNEAVRFGFAMIVIKDEDQVRSPLPYSK